MRRLNYSFIGELDYQRASELQSRLKDEVANGGDEWLLLLEHPRVITLGRSATRQDIRWSDDQLRAAALDVQQSERGGKVTLHAPGQLIGYAICRVGRSVYPHVQGLMHALERYLKERFSIEAAWEDDNPGLWTEKGKIAAIGVDARGGVTTHGFALNYTNDLDLFSSILPCGLMRPTTSVAQFSKDLFAIEELAEEIVPFIGQSLGFDEYRKRDDRVLS